MNTIKAIANSKIWEEIAIRVIVIIVCVTAAVVSFATLSHAEDKAQNKIHMFVCGQTITEEIPFRCEEYNITNSEAVKIIGRKHEFEFNRDMTSKLHIYVNPADEKQETTAAFYEFKKVINNAIPNKFAYHLGVFPIIFKLSYIEPITITENSNGMVLHGEPNQKVSVSFNKETRDVSDVSKDTVSLSILPVVITLSDKGDGYIELNKNADKMSCKTILMSPPKCSIPAGTSISATYEID